MQKPKVDRVARVPRLLALGRPCMRTSTELRLAEINSREFRELLTTGRALVVLFGSPTCEPCHAIEPHLAQLAQKHEGVIQVVKVDVDKQTDLGRRYKLWALPTVIQFYRGKHRRISTRNAAGLDKAMRQLLAETSAAGSQLDQPVSTWPEQNGPGLLPVSALHSSLAPFGRDIDRVGIPACLSRHGFSLEGLVVRIGKNDAAGLRVGCGQVLTNRHVFEQLGGDAEGAAFVGRKTFPDRPELFGRAAPPALPGGALVMPWYVGRYGDWALLDEADSSVCATSPMRSAKLLRKNEPLWLVGGSDGELDLVTVGRLKYVKGVNAILDDCDVRPGMSGSAVIDAAGHVVGIFSTQFGWPGRRAMFVTIDAIADGIDALRTLDSSLPVKREDIVS